ncbi:MAG: glutaminase A [Clostridia bacterium]|nr:glutaminase A [Clostridia bacterium]MBQ2110619.1 glutaminase A [Clostridia bacterium]MBQ3938494.1 glutaminase A [Clostridia bacterium]MBQ5488528.1 glutaminase A [Clostridia bacterium]
MKAAPTGAGVFPKLNKEKTREVFARAYELGLKAAPEGRVADYIPELAKADPNAFGIYMLNGEGESLAFGDVGTRFSIQSVCKVIILAIALKFKGFEETFKHVMMEPSGDSFNSILKLDLRSNLPFNPMINAGAIQTVSMLANDFEFEEIMQFARELCMDPNIVLNEAVYKSEAETGDRNRAIVYLLKSKGVLMADPEKTVDLYFKLCSLSVNARSLAALGLVISNGGVNPFSGENWIEPNHVRTLKSIMFTCGMYDFSGEFGVRVGVPSKSGVGGGIVCAARGPMGIGLYGPSLDPYGNSIAAVRAMEHISEELDLHVFDYL